MSNNTEARLTATIHGRVQGVSFRYYTRQTAQKLGVIGWVRNRPDGTVHIEAEGPRSKLEELAQFLQHGPPHAHVQQVQSRWRAATGEFEQFSIRR